MHTHTEILYIHTTMIITMGLNSYGSLCLLGLLNVPEDGSSNLSETLVNFYQITQHYISENDTFHVSNCITGITQKLTC
jgi:hypothetical protein